MPTLHCDGDPVAEPGIGHAEQQVDPTSHHGDYLHHLGRPLVQRAHVERIGHDQPGEAKRVAQDSGEHLRHHGARASGGAAQRRKGEVCRHDRARAGGDGGPERHQLERIEAAPVGR